MRMLYLSLACVGLLAFTGVSHAQDRSTAVTTSGIEKDSQECYYCVQCWCERPDGSCYWKDMYKCKDIDLARKKKKQYQDAGMTARIVERVVQ